MSQKFKNILLKCKYPITIIVFGVFIGFVGESSLTNRFEQKKEIEQLETEIEEYSLKFEKDKETLNRLKHDPEAIKEIAREKYYMKTEQEDIFIIEDTEDDENE